MYGHMNFKNHTFLFVCLDKSLRGFDQTIRQTSFIFNKSSKHPIPSHF